MGEDKRGGEKLLEELYKHLNDPSRHEEWADFDADYLANDFDSLDISEYETPEHEEKMRLMLDNAFEKFELEESEKRKRRALTRRRILQSIAAALLLFLAFVFFTEPGQAFGRYIVELLGFDLHIGVIDIPEGSYPTNTDFESESFGSVEEAAKFLGYPIIYVDHKDVTLDKINVSNFGFAIEIKLYYSNVSDGSFILYTFVTQGLYDSDSLAFDENGNYNKLLLSNGHDMYFYTNSDRQVTGTAIWDNIKLEIISDSIDLDRISNYIKFMNNS